MKHIYERFEEIADDFVKGESVTHLLSDHTVDECYPWQHGVREFTHFLDGMGIKMVANPEIFDKLWDNPESYKPLKFAGFRHKEMSGNESS